MKVTLVGGKHEALTVEEQEDGSYLGEDGTRYEMEHVSGVYTFVRKAEAVIESIEEAADKIIEELGAGDGAETETAEDEEEVADDGQNDSPAEETEDTPAEDKQGGASYF